MPEKWPGEAKLNRCTAVLVLFRIWQEAGAAANYDDTGGVFEVPRSREIEGRPKLCKCDSTCYCIIPCIASDHVVKFKNNYYA